MMAAKPKDYMFSFIDDINEEGSRESEEDRM